MQPKHQQLWHLHDKQEVVVGTVCIDNRHGNAKLLALILREQKVKRSHTRPVDISERLFKLI